MSSRDRRQFLADIGWAGSILSASTLYAADEARTSAANEVVLGVMGLSRGAALASGFAKLPGARVAYVCDVDESRASSCAARLEAETERRPEVVRDFRRILDDNGVDALVCAAPNHWHAPATILACTAGKHVYVEKPCSHNPYEGELMVRAARKHGRAVQMGTQRRSSSGTMEAMEKLQAGVIGRVYLARAWYYNMRGPIGSGMPAPVPAHLDYDLWQGPAPRREYVDNLVHYNWHWRWHWGNGELGNNGVHTIDLCRWGLDVEFASRITSSGGRYRFKDDQQTPDTHTVCFDFNNETSIVWNGLSCNRHGRDGTFVSFYGEEGALDLQSNGQHVVYDRQDKIVEKQESSDTGDRAHLENFLSAIRNDDVLNLNAEIAKGHASTLLCHLGNIAHRVGRTLHCDPSNGHILDDVDAQKYWKREYEPGWEPQV